MIISWRWFISIKLWVNPIENKKLILLKKSYQVSEIQSKTNKSEKKFRKPFPFPP